MNEPPIATLWYTLSLLFAEKHGEPLPKRLLEISDPVNGLLLKLNNTGETVDNTPQFGIFIYRNDWPLGLVEPGGGSLAVVKDFGEQELIAWADQLRSALSRVEVEDE